MEHIVDWVDQVAEHIVMEGCPLLVEHIVVLDNLQQMVHTVAQDNPVGQHIVALGAWLDHLELALVPVDMAVIPLVHTLH